MDAEIGRASCRERVLWVTGVQTCALPISEAERTEYDAYIDVISILQAKARSVLARQSSG